MRYETSNTALHLFNVLSDQLRSINRHDQKAYLQGSAERGEVVSIALNLIQISYHLTLAM